ncbi:MAG: hypothetical protein ACR2P0_08125 [Acidimicrobiales bacterium]
MRMMRGGVARRLRLVVVLAISTTLLVASPVAAQDDPASELVIDGSQATVTVIAGDSIVPGPSGGSGSGGRFVCTWASVFANTDVVLGRTVVLVEGSRYYLSCDPLDGTDEPDWDDQIIVYDPADPVPGHVTSLEVRDFVRDQGLVRPDPLLVGVSPSAVQITGVETWLWPDGSLDRVRASASAGGLTVTVEARFEQTVFDMAEDGVAPIVCSRQVEWQRGRDEPACAHTYLTEAAQRTITASSEWDFVWWDNAAQPGPVFWETVTLDEQLDVEVIDLEAVISSGR